MKILAITPDPNDGTAWWRVISPLSVLREQSGGEFDFLAVHEATHSLVSAHDLLLLQRPVRDSDKQAMEWAKRLGIPVVVDYDDDYLAVPKHNRMHVAYSQQEIKDNVKHLLRNADLVTVSTYTLKKGWQSFTNKIAVVPNGFDDRLVAARPPLRLPYRRVMWRGGDSHVKDVSRYSNAIVHAAQTGPQALWTFVGHSFIDLHDKIPQGSMQEYPFVNTIKWFETVGELGAHILIVPLEDTDFNHKKSNISIMEGSWSGAAVLAPDWEDWRAPGVTNYRGPKDFAEKLLELMEKSDEDLAAMSQQTWDSVRERLLVSRSNKLRVMLYGTLIANARKNRIKSIIKNDKLDEIVAQKLNPEDKNNAAVQTEESNLIAELEQRDQQ